MKMMHLTRRGFLRAACVVAGGAMISLRMAGVAVAYLKRPLGPLSEKLLHTRWADQSAGYRRLVEAGTFPNPRDVEMFAASPYPYEQKF